MKKIDENTKVTLTFEQLKKLVKEGVESNTRKMSYAEVESLIDNFEVKEKEMIHSFDFNGDVPYVGSDSIEGGTFDIDEEKLKLALENPDLRIFVFSVFDNGDYRLIGADSFDEYANLSNATNTKEELKSAKIEWDSPIGRTKNPDYGIYIRRLR